MGFKHLSSNYSVNSNDHDDEFQRIVKLEEEKANQRNKEAMAISAELDEIREDMNYLDSLSPIMREREMMRRDIIAGLTNEELMEKYDVSRFVISRTRNKSNLHERFCPRDKRNL